MKRQTIGLSVVAGVFWAIVPIYSGLVHAAQEAMFPTKPVRVIVPQTPGSSVDFFARVVTDRLHEKWGVPIVVDNRGGAGGAIAMELVKEASPDGYTLAVSTEGALAIVPHLYRKPRYNTLKDFVAITRVASAPYVLIANPALPATSVKELIALAKARPGQINFGSGGKGSGTHLSGELFKLMAGIDIVHVPYKGGSLAMRDVISGQIQIMFTGVPNALGQVRAGTLKALAVTTAKPISVLPGVPPVTESGLEGYVISPWWGVVAPAGTPSAMVRKLYGDIAAVLKEDVVKRRYAAQGAEPVGDTPEQFAKVLKAEYAKWGKVVKDADVPVN